MKTPAMSDKSRTKSTFQHFLTALKLPHWVASVNATLLLEEYVFSIDIYIEN